MQQARENQHVCLVVRRYHRNPLTRLPFDSISMSNQNNDQNIRYVTLNKNHENQSFGFVIISSQGRTGATVGKKNSSMSFFQ